MFPPVDWILDMNIQHLCRSGFPGGSNGKESACNVGDPGSYVLLILLLLLSRFSRVWLCNPIDGSPPGSPVPGILQARTPEWVAISFSNAWKWKAKMKSLSRVWLLATPWTATHQAPQSMDSPGKSTRVGCHCLLVYLKNIFEKRSFSQFLVCQLIKDWEERIYSGDIKCSILVILTLPNMIIELSQTPSDSSLCELVSY